MQFLGFMQFLGYQTFKRTLNMRTFVHECLFVCLSRVLQRPRQRRRRRPMLPRRRPRRKRRLIPPAFALPPRSPQTVLPHPPRARHTRATPALEQKRAASGLRALRVDCRLQVAGCRCRSQVFQIS